MSKLDRYSPPGSTATPIYISIYGSFAVLFIAWFGFVICGEAAWSSAAPLSAPTLRELLRPWMLRLFAYLVMACLFYVPVYYHSFFLESKSIYTMRRISNPWELHLRCWSVPLLGVAIIAGAMVVFYWSCCATYFLFTSNGVVPEQQIGLFWRYVP